MGTIGTAVATIRHLSAHVGDEAPRPPQCNAARAAAALDSMDNEQSGSEATPSGAAATVHAVVKFRSSLHKFRSKSATNLQDDEPIATCSISDAPDETIPDKTGTGFKQDGKYLSELSTRSSLNSVGSGLNTISWQILHSPKFEAAMGCVIIANSISIGVEQTMALNGDDPTVILFLENVFIAIYIMELGLRLYVHGRQCFNDNWVRFDALLVIMGITTQWILQPILGEIDGIAPLMVLRMARLVRLARAVRLLVKFKELWMLVQGMVNSGATVFYTLVILVVVLYIFSSVAMELITNSTLNTGPNADPEFSELVAMHFASLPLSMVTLMQFATLDSISLIYVPLIKKDWTLAIYFISLILVVGIALMNLTTAVVVNTALEQAYQDKSLQQEAEKKERKKLLIKLKAIFRRLDDDDSGEVTREEINNIDDSDRKQLEIVMGISDPTEIFDMLDIDKSGSLAIDEFCEGIWQMVTQPGSLEVKRLEKKIDALRMRVDVFSTCQLDMSQVVGRLESSRLFQPSSRSRRQQVFEASSSEEMPMWAKEMTMQLHQQNSAIASRLQEVLNGFEELALSQRMLPSSEILVHCNETAGDRHSISQSCNPSGDLGKSFRIEGCILHRQLLAVDAQLLSLMSGALSPDFAHLEGVSEPHVAQPCSERFDVANQLTEIAGKGLRSNSAQCSGNAMCMPVSPPSSLPATLLKSSTTLRTPNLTTKAL